MGILSTSSIANIASAHGVACRFLHDRLELRGRSKTPEGTGSDEWIDATGWSISVLMRWLGY